MSCSESRVYPTKPNTGCVTSAPCSKRCRGFQYRRRCCTGDEPAQRTDLEPHTHDEQLAVITPLIQSSVRSELENDGFIVPKGSLNIFDIPTITQFFLQEEPGLTLTVTLKFVRNGSPEDLLIVVTDDSPNQPTELPSVIPPVRVTLTSYGQTSTFLAGMS